MTSAGAWRRAFGVVLFGAALACALCVVFGHLGQEVNPFDESMLYLRAALMQRGERVNVDFHSVYPFLNYQLTSWAFALFGETALAGRLVGATFFLVALAALTLLFRREGARGWTLGALLLASVVLMSPLPGFASSTGVGFALLCAIAYAWSISSGSRLALAAAGALAGLALWSRTNFGAYVCVTILLTEASTSLRNRRLDLARAASWVVPLGAVAGITALAHAGSLLQVLRETVSAPARTGRLYSFDPLDAGLSGWPWVEQHLWLLLPVLPLLFLGCRAPSRPQRLGWLGSAGLVLFVQVWLGQTSPAGLRAVVTCIPLVLAAAQFRFGLLPSRQFAPLLCLSLFVHYYIYRPDPSHHAPAVAIVPLLLPFLFGTPLAETPRRWRAAALAFVTLVALPGGLGTARIVSACTQNGIAALRAGLLTGSDAERIAADLPLPPPLARLYPAADEVEVVRFLRERTQRSDAVYVGLTNHARPYLNTIRVAWMLGRPTGTRHHMLMTGIVETQEAQQAMIADLRVRRVRWTIREKNANYDKEFRRRTPPGSTLLDAYLASHCEAVACFGRFTVEACSL